MAARGLDPRDTLGSELLVSPSQDIHRIHLLDPSSSSGREDAPRPGSRKGWDDRPCCRREPDGELREASDEAGCDAGVAPDGPTSPCSPGTTGPLPEPPPVAATPSS